MAIDSFKSWRNRNREERKMGKRLIQKPTKPVVIVPKDKPPVTTKKPKV